MADERKIEKPQARNPSPEGGGPADDNLEQLQDVEVEISIELGRRKLTLDQALELGDDSVVELDKLVGEPVDVRLNGKLFARGEIVTVGGNFGVRLSEILGKRKAQEG